MKRSSAPMKRILVLFLVLLLCFVGTARAANGDGDVVMLGGREVAYWQPAQADSGKHPLILFSHGFMSCPTQSRFLMRALAADGYWVFAPFHADSACHGQPPQVSFELNDNFLRPDLWADDSYHERRDDMQAVLAALRVAPEFARKIDFDRLGLAGHSLGGYTVLGLAGAWPSWRMPGVKAVLALSPYSAPFNVRASMGGLTAPVMFQGGTRDYIITPYTARPGGSYDRAPMPKYFVNFAGAGHLAWMDRQRTYQDSIVRYATAFFDHYIKDQAASADLVTPTPDSATLRFASDLGSR